jgi:hypothetical protein
MTPPTRTGPRNSETNEEGKRWYVFGDEPRLLSCSTATGIIGTEALMIWAAGLAAKAAFVELPTIVTSSRKKPCERSYNRCKHPWNETCERCPCGDCRGCVTKWLRDRHVAESTRRGDEGTRTHDVIEWWSNHGQILPHKPDIAPYVAAFEAFVEEYGLTQESFLASECTVVNREHGYAGTCDGIVRIVAAAAPAAAELVARVLFADGEYQQFAEDRDGLIAAVVADNRHVDLIFDTKTQEKTKDKANWYPDQALQVTGYRWAPVVRFKNTDVEVPMPDTHGALILQLRPDGCTPRLVVADDESFLAFLHAVALCRWWLELGPKSVQVGAFPLPKKAPVKRTRAATPRRAAALASVTPIGSGRSRAAADPFPARTDRPIGSQLDDADIPF